MPFQPLCTWRRWMLAAALAAVSFSGLAQSVADAPDAIEEPSLSSRVSPLSLDTSTATTDLSINTPTAWWFYTGINATQVSNYITTNAARLTDIEVQSVSGGVPTFTVRTSAQRTSSNVAGARHSTS